MSIWYQDWILIDRPRWLVGLRDGWGELWHRVHGAVADLIVDALVLVGRAGIIETAPDDALPYHASERSLERYPDETLPAWRYRLAHAWTEWDKAGRADGLERNVALYCGAGFAAVEARDRWSFDGADGGEQWSQVWVVIGDGAVTLPWEPSLLGSITLGDGGTLGSSATVLEVADVKRLFRKWKSAHSYAGGVILMFPGDAAIPDPYDYTRTMWELGKLLGRGNHTLSSYTLGGYR